MKGESSFRRPGGSRGQMEKEKKEMMLISAGSTLEYYRQVRRSWGDLGPDSAGQPDFKALLDGLVAILGGQATFLEPFLGEGFGGGD